MAARNQQEQEGKIRGTGQARAQRMAFEMVDGEERFTGRRRDGLAHGRADHDAADPPQGLAE